jgi:predicted ester cyclase
MYLLRTSNTKTIMKSFFLIAGIVIAVTSCNDKGSTSTAAHSNDSTIVNESPEAKEERNKQTALASLHAFDGETNLDEVFKDADKDIVEYNNGEMPALKGVDSIKKWMQPWISAIPDYKGSDLIAVADGDYVMVHGTWTGTWKNNMMGMNATNKSFKVADVDIFKFNEAGKMIEHRNVQSMDATAKQIGMKMPK